MSPEGPGWGKAGHVLDVKKKKKKKICRGLQLSRGLRSKPEMHLLLDAPPPHAFSHHSRQEPCAPADQVLSTQSGLS